MMNDQKHISFEKQDTYKWDNIYAGENQIFKYTLTMKGTKS